MSMEKRTMGNTGMEVSVLGFGGAEIGFEGASLGEVERLLGSALDQGLNVIDTAECYMNSEELIGQTMSKRRGDFYLFTKCGHGADYTVDAWSYDDTGVMCPGVAAGVVGADCGAGAVAAGLAMLFNSSIASQKSHAPSPMLPQNTESANALPLVMPIASNASGAVWTIKVLRSSPKTFALSQRRSVSPFAPRARAAAESFR